MVRKLLNRRDNEIAAVGSVNASLLRVSLSLRSRTELSSASIFHAIRPPHFTGYPAFFHQTAIAFSGLLWQNNRHAHGSERLEYFGNPFIC